MKILIVDDNPTRYSSIIEKIEKDDANEYNIQTLTNVKDALNALENNVFDVLVVDMMLPRRVWDRTADPAGGITILTHLQEDDSLNIPRYVIGITSATDDDTAVAEHFHNSSWTLLRAVASDNWQDRLLHQFKHAQAAINIAATRQYDLDVCFITALHNPEFKAVINLPIDWELSDYLCDESTFVKRGKLKTAEGNTLRVVAACAMRMGGVEAAILTGKLIECFRPRMIVMTGICAGLEGKVNLGDVIVANPTWDWTSSKWDLDDSQNPRILPSPDYIGVDREIIAKIRNIEDDSAFLTKLQDKWPAGDYVNKLRIHTKPSASGTIVVADGSTLKNIQVTQNREVLGLEMEAYGVYAAVRAAASPRPLAVSIKSVCDFADPRKEDKAQSYAAYTSASVAFEYLYRFGVPANG